MPDPDLNDEPRRAARTILLIAGVLALAVAAYALIGFFVVPPLARRAVQTQGAAALHRPVTVGEVTFNPFTFEAGLRAFSVRDRDGQPLFSLKRLRLRLRPSGITERAWRLSELTIDEPSLRVRFLPDGKLSFADVLAAHDDKSPAPRVIVDRLSIHDGRLEYADDSATPRFKTTFAPLNAVVRNLVTIPGAHGEHALSIGFDRQSMIRVAGRQTLEPLGMSGHIDISGVDLPAVAQRFATDAPLVVRAGQADATLDYDLRKEPAGMRLRVSRGQLTLANLALASRGPNAQTLVVPRVEVRDASLTLADKRAEIGSVRVVGVRGAVGFDPQGRFNWSSSTSTAAPSSSAPAANTAPSTPWRVRINRAAIEGGTLHYEDQQTSPPIAVDLTALTIGAAGLTNDATMPIAFTASASTGSGSSARAGRIALDGQIVPSPFSIDSRSSLASVDLLPFRPWVSTIPGLTLDAGSVDFNGRLLVSSAQPYLIEGDGALNGIEFLDSAHNRLLGCRTAALHRLRLDGSTSRFRIGSAGLDGLYANVVIDKQRNLNLSAIGASSTPAAPQKGSVDIGTIDISNATIDYRDDSLVLPFATAITSTSGKITDFSTTSAAAATVKLAGNVAEHGAMNAEGTMRMADPFAGTSLFLHFRGVPMPTLTPYAAEFAGYEIQSGDLDVDVRYRIAERKLQGDHRISASGLTLGRKVGGTKAGFATRLAVALLKDRQGRIEMEVPIEGTIDSPEFNYRAVLWQAVKTILGNTARAPFRALGRAIGSGDNDDLQTVSFEPGQAIVIPPQAEKLRKMATELAPRNEVGVGVEGKFDSELDAKAMKRAKFESLLASRRDRARPGGSDPPSLDAILEELYSEAFSPDKLAAARAKFTTEASQPPAPAPSRKFWKHTPPPLPPPPATFDANGFYDALRTQLVAAQAVSPDELRSLARARATAIAAVLTSGGPIEPSRVTILDAVEAKRQPGSRQIEAEMKLSAVGATTGENADE